MRFAEYQKAFRTAAIERDEAGVLTVRLHSKGDSLWWGALPHRELTELFAAIASDRDTRVVVLTGTGDWFIRTPPESKVGQRPIDMAAGLFDSDVYDLTMWEGTRLLKQLLEIDVPVIAAVNGPVNEHSELALLSDIVICTDETFFADEAHFPSGLVPGDGQQIIWPLLLGPNRGRYFLLTGQAIQAQEALRLGVVAEVLPADDLMKRADQLAHELARRNPILLRNTRRTLVRPLQRAISDELQGGLALEMLSMISGRDWRGPHRFDADTVDG